MSNRAISQHTGRDHKTVAKYLDQGLELPSYKPRPAKPGKLDPYKDYLRGHLYDCPRLGYFKKGTTWRKVDDSQINSIYQQIGVELI